MRSSVFYRARQALGRWGHRRATPTVATGQPPVPSSSLGVAAVGAFRAGRDVAAGGRAHALPVVRSTPAQVSILFRPACGAPVASGLRLAGDWRELPADLQCPSCHQVVAA
jgi:1,6-anhydro-N-acetylmuramate kinase